ncbi:MAG TPA: hypothetical protein VI612_02670 [Candidatus Nanoarchaeia archaeon]|nr:hypothetical protein [Candidatus Nanoarchaeia archaeon]
MMGLAKTLVGYAPGFVVYAIAMDLLDDVLIPLAIGWLGHPVLGGLAFALDLDWLTYPAYFAVLYAARRKTK